jgi:isopenicillin-N epimerase
LVTAARPENLRGLWSLDYTRLHVNHGSYGAAPRRVLDEQARWRDLMEQGTTYFMQDVLPDALRAAAGELASYVGAEAGDLVFVDNATSGINAVLASLDLRPGDEILLHSHIYGAVLKTAEHIAARTGAVITSAELPFPDPSVESIVTAFAAAVTPRTRIVILDHITSPSALVLPLEQLVAVFRDAGVPVLVDGAHAPGNVPVDLALLGVDYYVGNCHKWLMAPKGVGFLWAAPARQQHLHPTIISHGYGSGFVAEFDWTGTRDWSAALAVPAAIAFHNELGGPALMRANRELAWEAARYLADRWRTPIAASPGFFASMSLVRAPFNGTETLALRRQLRELGADVPIIALAGALWIRPSAQAYNRLDDYVKLADLMSRLKETD